MSATASSNRAVLSTTPRFFVDGERRPRLSVDLQELEVHQDERGLSTLECTFVNWGARRQEGTGFLYFDDTPLRLGAQIHVEIGDDQAGDELASSVVFRGFIASLGARYGEEMPPLLVVRADDNLQKLRMNRHSRSFEDLTDEELVQQIAAANQLRLQSDVEGSRQQAYWQINRSDLAVLRERAEAADAVLAIEEDTLSFQPRRSRTQSPLVLTWFRELLSFEVDADLAHQRQSVHVHGYSVTKKKGVHARAGHDALRVETNGGKTGPEILTALDIAAEEHLHLESPTTERQARQLAETLTRARGRRFVRGYGKTAGSPALRVGRPVELKGLGSWFDGLYDPFLVRHTFDRAVGFRTFFSAERADFGGAP